MQYASPEHSLKVLIEANFEEVKFYDGTKETENPEGMLALKPREVSVSLHNPTEPADIRSSSFQIRLGQSITVYVTPKAREIDESGKELTESQRDCRINDDTDDLLIFNVYTRTACLFECKMKYSIEKCGCNPWDYPLDIKHKVRNSLFSTLDT